MTAEKKTDCRSFSQFLLGYFLINLLFYYFFPGQGGSRGLQTRTNKDRIRVLSPSPLRGKRGTQETGRGETQTRTKDGPSGLDVQPQQSFSAQPGTRLRADRGLRQPGLGSDAAAVLNLFYLTHHHVGSFPLTHNEATRELLCKDCFLAAETFLSVPSLLSTTTRPSLFCLVYNISLI